MMSAAYIAETCVNFFGESFFKNATIEGKFVRPVYAGDVVTTHGVVKAKVPEGDGYRLTVELWADDQDGEVKTVATVTAVVS
jgi:acyl dehydratase